MAMRLEEIYKTKLKPALQKELNLSNEMEVPKVNKIVLNTGIKESVSDAKAVAAVKEVIGLIAGQAGLTTYAKKSVAGFKLKEGSAIGVKVTLRGQRMYNFLDKLINLALPRNKDFQGVKVSFDGNGNYNLGIKDWMIFPEVDYDKVEISRGLNITIETSSKNDKHVYALLKSFNMPFQKVKE
ncbi:TPA: 50S ribosomal protein L5 [Candidatus Dependentiae bacterium]|nr:MAG: 50S ribosomal protein L5 [candidate division TM6 bacterium GW2011_GWE2_31_21]KKP53115.1 MAG: 50S ribosomal protein L5 [candidate division TM6 bacterium GW2011_GWF2_33_332]HBS47934.1 50S ribosomal protein L5 [Candidatus Dependentiae bacterium]HBZ73462.1 50S ribosomal protein L5 [Candidatus Dependentiae bacterium]